MLAGAILALLFLAAVWAIVLVFAMPSWIAILATAFVLFGAAAFLVWGRLRARAASREIERSLGQQADAHAQAVRPDQQAEIEAMRGEFQKAVRSLKTSKLAKGGADALAVLPWYMIIGPPGAGKSTALRASGLKFPFLSARGGGVKGVGGTRNCEWWLTNEAVILDTAGRYATEEDDRDEWLGFLDVLLRTRPRKPINGLIVAVSVADIGGWPEEGVVDLAKGLRDRVDEVMSRLQIVLPTYLLFTKADLMPGFVETFGDLRKNERGQIWGFTLAQGATAEQRAGIYQEHFDELLACVEERALQRIGEERQLAARERIHGFPQ
ncbi:MAG: type VI secretion protein IcmF/TssM N-terminal domain-containing protein, partial [Myxococcales bacterium]